jgi:hypothetical protein
MARRALVKNLKNHIGNSLMAMLGPYSAAVMHCASLNLLAVEMSGVDLDRLAGRALGTFRLL